MDNLNISPELFFTETDSFSVTINGIKTQVAKMSDQHGSFFAISATNPLLSNICGTIVLNKLIYEVDYLKYQGHVAIIKAYYH